MGSDVLVCCHGLVVEWINQQAESQGKESVEIPAWDFRHGHSDTSSICLQLESLPLRAVYMRIALIQVSRTVDCD